MMFIMFIHKISDMFGVSPEKKWCQDTQSTKWNLGPLCCQWSSRCRFDIQKTRSHRTGIPVPGGCNCQDFLYWIDSGFRPRCMKGIVFPQKFLKPLLCCVLFWESKTVLNNASPSGRDFDKKHVPVWGWFIIAIISSVTYMMTSGCLDVLVLSSQITCEWWSYNNATNMVVPIITTCGYLHKELVTMDPLCSYWGAVIAFPHWFQLGPNAKEGRAISGPSTRVSTSKIRRKRTWHWVI